MPDLVTVQCETCGVAFEALPIAGYLATHCETCALKAEPSPAITRLAWETLVGSFRSYLDTRMELLPCQGQSRRVISWCGGNGFNLWGPTATGKTRSLFLLLRRLYSEGNSMKIFGPSDFAGALTAKGFKAADWVLSLRRYDLLAFDDLAKVRLTPVQEGHLFGLIEAFGAAGKPIFVTHNYDAKELSRRFKEGAPLITRLRRYFTSIHFGPKPTP